MAIEQEFQQNKIATSAYEYQKGIDKKEKIIVGVNKFDNHLDEQINTQNINKEAIKEQLERLEKFKNNRNKKDVQDALINLKDVVNSNTNIMPHIIYAIKSNVTLGEISDVLRNVFGEY